MISLWFGYEKAKMNEKPWSNIEDSEKVCSDTYIFPIRITQIRIYSNHFKSQAY